jgi:hypothetical protein
MTPMSLSRHVAFSSYRRNLRIHGRLPRISGLARGLLKGCRAVGCGALPVAPFFPASFS